MNVFHFFNEERALNFIYGSFTGRASPEKCKFLFGVINITLFMNIKMKILDPLIYFSNP